ncbi:MAG: S9 family peptidase [Kiritimatiellae bacterium]|nr:S9 family peptidase [Kiritimatiellia bacterium]
MSSPRTAPCGTWKSPIRAADIAHAMIGLGSVRLAAGGAVYWLEVRPNEGGRYVVVRRSPDGFVADALPPGFSARTRVHEYGGGSYTVHDRTVFFANDADRRVYRYEGRDEPQPLTPPGDMLYADFEYDRSRRRLICVREDRSRGGEPINTIVAIRAEACGDDPGDVLVGGNDFYSSPRLSADGQRLAWQAWNHPNMPWDASDIKVATVLANGRLGEVVHVAGSGDESVAQPEWSPDHVLYFVSDRDNWWNIYRWQDGEVEQVTKMKAEFASPHWVFGLSHYAFASAERLVCACTQEGTWRVAGVDTLTRKLTTLTTPFTAIDEVRADAERMVVVAGSPVHPTSIVSIRFKGGRAEVLKKSTDLAFDAGCLSTPEAVEFPTEAGLTAHGLFYRPKNQDYRAPAGEKPPLVVRIHGGPTHATSTAMRLGIQYYTSRGIAVLDVNYGGSTGYGRAYRMRLAGQWGVVDVDDVCHGARYLAARGLVDGKRLAISGGSAGGYTVLAALALRDVFAAGASHFGVSDCELLARETHKFEKHYLDRLIAPYPEKRQLYLERSPIRHLTKFNCPVIFFQGLEDKIVPPDQTERMFEALKQKGLPTAYLAFPGEQHGFRKAETIQRVIEAELYFFSRVLGFELADPVEPVKIENA